MSERPILFSGDSVRAILDGSKTQTRRVVKPAWQGLPMENADYAREAIAKCPYGVVGDRLWVRETWASLIFTRDWETGYVDDWFEAENPKGGTFVYRAGSDGWDDNGPTAEDRGFRWRSPIHMPRSASRLSLEITNIRVERVQSLTYADAKAEGMQLLDDENRDEWSAVAPPGDTTWPTLPEYFARVWDDLNYTRGYSWESNPFVWVLEFRICVPSSVVPAVDPSWSTPHA